MPNNPNLPFALGPNAATLSYPAQQLLLGQYADKAQSGELYNHPQWSDWGDRMRRSGFIHDPSMPTSGGVRQGPTMDDLILRISPGQNTGTYKPRLDPLPFQIPPGKPYDPMANAVPFTASDQSSKATMTTADQRGNQPLGGSSVAVSQPAVASYQNDLQVVADKQMPSASFGKKDNPAPDTLIKIYNPNHYTPSYLESRGGHGPVTKVPSYDNRHYYVNIPHGQNVDHNIAMALMFNQSMAGMDVPTINKSLMKGFYLRSHNANGTVGDYGKNQKLYPSSDHAQRWQRELGGNFNLGAIGAALGFSLKSLLTSGHGLSIAHTGHAHPQSEQDAIEDGYWYFYQTHPDAAKRDGITVPKGVMIHR